MATHSGGGGNEDGGGGGIAGGVNRSGIELFLIDEGGRQFKVMIVYEWYFFLVPADRTSEP